MRGKKFWIWILVLLFAIPTGMYAAPGISGRSISSGKYYAPVKVQNGKLDDYSWSVYSQYRNQISEMVSYEETGNGYDLTFYVGSYDSLDLIQIVKQEYSEELLTDGAAVGSSLALGDYNLPTNWSLPTNYTVSESVNYMYYDETSVQRTIFDEDMNQGKITVHVTDLNKPLIVRTWSAKAETVLSNQILSIDTEDAFSLDSWDDSVVMESVWMGKPVGAAAGTTAIKSNSRQGKKTDGTTVFDIGFLNDNISVSRLESGKVEVVIPMVELEGDNYFEKLEVANSRKNLDSTDSTFSKKEAYQLNDYWAYYEEATTEGGKLILTFDSLEEAALGKMMRITTTKTATTHSSKESKHTYQYASIYIKPELFIPLGMMRLKAA